MSERDCEHCIHKVPVFDEEGYCKYAQCDSWNCEYVNRKEALEAWIEKYKGRTIYER